MATEPPREIKEYFDHIKQSTWDSLMQANRIVDPRAFRGPSAQPPLSLSVQRTADLQKNYLEIQKAFFDFVGKCPMCPETTQHVHGMQASAVLEVERFPGKHSNGMIHAKHVFANKI